MTKIGKFEVEEIQERIYGKGYRLKYVHIFNTETKKHFEDWVRPAQIRTEKNIQGLILW